MWFVSLTATSMLCLFFTFLLIEEGHKFHRPRIEVLASVAAVVSLTSSIADYESLLHPFQVGLSVSRLIYVVALWLIAKALFNKDNTLCAAAMSVATIAVTFHGSRQIFAICVLFIHLASCRDPFKLVIGVLPLAVGLIVQENFSPGGGELATSSIRAAINAYGIGDLIKGVSAFFAVSFYAWAQSVMTDPTLLILGTALAAGTILACASGAVDTLGLTVRDKPAFSSSMHLWAVSGTRARSMEVYGTSLGLFVLASALATSVV